jgi:DNA-binding transcriptional LysR family regulator
MLMESQVQFLLTHAPVDSKNNLDKQGYPYVVVGKDWLVPVSAPKKDGTAAHALNKGTVKNPCKLLSYSTESGLSRIVDITHAKLSKQLPTKTVFTAHLASVLRTMALDGRGVAWLPQTLVTDDLESGLLVAAAPKSWCVDMQIRLYRDKATISQAAENFWRNNLSPTEGVLA